MKSLRKKPLLNPLGNIDVRKRRMISGNTMNLSDFNNMKYGWVSEWYRQAMNNSWVPERTSLGAGKKDYPTLSEAERRVYDKILSFLVFSDSIRTANLPAIGEYVMANEINLCLSIQMLQKAVHSQSYSHMLDTICEPQTRNEVLYQWKSDEHLLARNTFIGELYDEFQKDKGPVTFMKTVVASYILKGIYFYSGFMFFYNLGRNHKMPGSAQETRYINRDENTHLRLFRSITKELEKEEPELFTEELVDVYRGTIREGCKQEIAQGRYAISDDVPGLTREMVTGYIQYLGNLRCTSLGFGATYEGHEKEPESIPRVSQYSNANMIKTDFFGARSTAYAKSSVLVDDL